MPGCWCSKAFVYESGRTGRDGVWTNFDTCTYSAFYQLWTISAELGFSSNSFQVIAKTVTTDTEIRTYKSNSFIIREPEVSTTTTSLATSAGVSDISSFPLSSSTSPASQPTSMSRGRQLSTGTKAGIGIGSAFAVIGLLLMEFWLHRRRRIHQKHSAPVNPPEGNEKPELDGEAVKRPVGEADGQQIFEADGVTAARQKPPPQDLVELPTERSNREV